MRVISGKYKGRQLKGPDDWEIRPTGDRLKETLFNILGPGIAGSAMLDVFGGTGAAGIAALSRGAREVAFIESSPVAQRLILRNIHLCGIETGYRILQQDVFMALRALARHGLRVDVVFFDPPYDWKPYRDLLEIIFDRRLLSDHGRAVVEHHRKSLLPDSGERYQRRRIVRQGDHCLSFYEHSTGVGSQESDVRMDSE
jgi:16S rRNA (guanine966-N2)-methyltransferase